MSSDQIQIRKAVASDVEAIIRLTNAGGPNGNPRKLLPDVLPPTYAEAFGTIDADPNQFLMVAAQGNTVVGTFHMTLITYLAGEGRPDAQVEAIHVAAEHRRSGIGTMMLKWVIAEAEKRHCRRVQLTTDKQRTEAHTLYLRLGFKFSHEGAKLYL